MKPQLFTCCRTRIVNFSRDGVSTGTGVIVGTSADGDGTYQFVLNTVPPGGDVYKDGKRMTATDAQLQYGLGSLPLS